MKEKLEERLKKHKFSYFFHTSLLQLKKFFLLFYLFLITVSHQITVKKECVNGYQLLRHSVITERSPYHFPCRIKNQKLKIQNTNNRQIFVVNKEKTACDNL